MWVMQSMVFQHNMVISLQVGPVLVDFQMDAKRPLLQGDEPLIGGGCLPREPTW